MRVTNEQIRAEIICTQGESCDGCPFYGVDKCDDLRGNDFNMYKDLLEARGLIKEMREELESARTVMEKYESQLTGEQFNDPSLNAILEKTKDYA